MIYFYYLRRRLASGEGTVTLGVCVCVRRAATVRRISLGGEGNALYPMLFSLNGVYVMSFFVENSLMFVEIFAFGVYAPFCFELGCAMLRYTAHFDRR